MSNARIDAIECAERWLETARQEVASIRAWRRVAHNEAMHSYWSTLRRNPHDDAPTMPRWFYPDTCALVALMADEFGNLSTTPITKVYAAVFFWHKHRRAERRLRQSALEATLERAAIAIMAIRRRILKDIRPGKTAAEPAAPSDDATGAATKPRRGRPRGMKATDKAGRAIAKMIRSGDAERFAGKWAELLERYRDELPAGYTSDALRKRITRAMNRT